MGAEAWPNWKVDAESAEPDEPTNPVECDELRLQDVDGAGDDQHDRAE